MINHYIFFRAHNLCPFQNVHLFRFATMAMVISNSILFLCCRHCYPLFLLILVRLCLAAMHTPGYLPQTFVCIMHVNFHKSQKPIDYSHVSAWSTFYFRCFMTKLWPDSSLGGNVDLFESTRQKIQNYYHFPLPCIPLHRPDLLPYDYSKHLYNAFKICNFNDLNTA